MSDRSAIASDVRSEVSPLRWTGTFPAMGSRLPFKRDFRRWGHELESAVDDGVDEVRRWLATPQGRFLRSLAARMLIVSVPLIVRHPFFKTPVGRLVELAGGAAILIKLAELLRDWEPTPEMPREARAALP
jgi:hypothetical protein